MTHIDTTISLFGKSPQKPFTINGFSVFANDINVGESDIGNFSGKITDPFNDIYSTIVDNTANNPKELIVAIERTTFTSFIGLGTETGTFSNVKVELLGSGGDVKATIDNSADSTAYNSLTLAVPGVEGFNKLRFTFHTTNTISIGNIVIFKDNRTLSTIQGLSELLGITESVATFRNALKVDTALVHTVGTNVFFFKETGITSTLAVATLVTDTQITVVDATGFAIGNKLKLATAILQGQPLFTITNIVGNVITLDRPVSVVLPIGADVDVVSTNMGAEIGTLASPVIYKIMPPSGATWQLTRMLMSVVDGSTMDDGKFGGQTALTNGINLRVIKGSGDIQNITNWKTNGDLALDMFDVVYTDKAPAGNYGMRGRWTFTNGQYVIELNGDNGDYLELLIQDALTQEIFEMKCQGRLFNG
jgi:hypothetical protein